ncbi:MAG: ABC transporter ATP-binding protein [Candidatus Methanosuratincola sp.]
MGNVIEFKDLKVIFKMDGMEVTALCGVDLELQRGEILGILGESGSGKTVLLHAALRLLPANAVVNGQILYNGTDLLALDRKKAMTMIGREFSLIPQGFGSLNPMLKCWLQISERPMEHFKIGSKNGYCIAERLLFETGLRSPASVARSYRHELSGGMIQRVLVSMGASGPSEVMFLDEPTKGLDQRKKGLVIELLRIARQGSNSMIVVSHDLQFLKEVSDRICVMYCGDILEVSDTREFFESPKHPYSCSLMKSLPSNGLKPIKGEIPSMVSPPGGCRFSPRCGESQRKCFSERPPMYMTKGIMVRCFKYA